MRPTEPLPLQHSWPIFERGQRFDMACVYSGSALAAVDVAPETLDPQELARQGIGVWECDLAHNALTWSPQVYDVFGLPRDAAMSRAETLALYHEESRAAMERLRAYAIRHRRGFTLDVKIRPGHGVDRWVRLMTAPVCIGGRVVRLQGLKQDVSREYD